MNVARELLTMLGTRLHGCTAHALRKPRPFPVNCV